MAAPAAPGDVVRLKNGGLLRGTIVELKPGESVAILLPSGETRTVLAPEISYAGAIAQDVAQDRPADRAESTVDPHRESYATVHADRARLHLEGAAPDLTFHLEVSSAGLTYGRADFARGYDRLCTAPCGVDVPAGYHRFGLSRSDGHIVQADDEALVHDGDTVRASYEGRRGLRVVGYVLIPTSIVGAIALLAAGVATGGHEVCTGATFCFHQAGVNAAFGIASAVTLIGGVVTGFVLARMGDVATITVVPHAGGVSSSARGRELATEMLPDLRLHVSF